MTDNEQKTLGNFNGHDFKGSWKSNKSAILNLISPKTCTKN